MSAIEQLVEASQAQYQRYCELFGASPVGGDGMRGLATRVNGVAQNVDDTRGRVIGLGFSSAVVASYAGATRDDVVPVRDAAQFATDAASVIDASATVNMEGAQGVAAIARSEASEIAAVPDPDSAEGQAQIVAIINKHQEQAAAVVTKSALAEQALGGRAAAAGGEATPQQLSMSSPDDQIVESDKKRNPIQLVDNHTNTGEAQPTEPGSQPQIGPFPVPPEVAAAAPPHNPADDPLGKLLLPSTAPFLAPSDPLTDALRRLGSPVDPNAPLSPNQINELIRAEVQNKLDEAERFSLNKLLGKSLEGCGLGGITAGVGGLIVGPLDPLVIAGGCVVGAIGDGGHYILESK